MDIPFRVRVVIGLLVLTLGTAFVVITLTGAFPGNQWLSSTGGEGHSGVLSVRSIPLHGISRGVLAGALLIILALGMLAKTAWDYFRGN